MELLDAFEYNHTEVSTDGTILYCQRNERGLNLPPYRGIIGKVERVKDIKLNDGDVIIMSQPKSGTHWVANLVNLLQNKENLEQDKWTPRHYFWENPLVDESSLPSPHIIKTHLINVDLPMNAIKASKARVILLNREAKDRFVSEYIYMTKAQMFKGTMEGFLELTAQGRRLMDSEFERLLFNKKIESDLGDRCLNLMYEQLKLEPEKYVRVLAEHIGVTVTSEEITKILDKSSVKKMAEMEKWNRDAFVEVVDNMYRKGEIGDWKNHFTVAFNELFDDQQQKMTATK